MAAYTAEMRRAPTRPIRKCRRSRNAGKRWSSVFTGGDPAIEQNLKRLWTEQGDKMAAQFGYDPKLMEYLAKANAAAKT